jgi:mRNA-degrading endonuclease RelE of RelBE toxin-antitoxin system
MNLEKVVLDNLRILPNEKQDEYDFSKAVRVKYHEKYRTYQGKIPVNITSNDGDRYVTLCTVKVEAIVTPDGKLTVQLNGDITPGEYRVTLIIEEPATLNTEPTSLENER